MSVSGGFVVTHVAPREGLQVWREPDPTGPVVSQVQGGVQLQLLERRGAWARVAFSNGWSGWVDGRRIVDAAGRAPAAPPHPQPAAAVQPAPTHQTQSHPQIQAPRPAPSLDKRPAPTDPTELSPFEPQPQSQPAPPRMRPPEPVPQPAGPAPASRSHSGGGGGSSRSRSGSRGGSRMPALPAIGNVQLTLALIGAAGVLLGTILSWIRVAGARSNAYDVPLAFLWDYKAGSDGGLKVGLLLLALAIFVGVFSIMPGQVAARRALGGVAVAVAVIYTIQLQRLLSAAGDAAPSLLSAIGFGVLVTIASGVGVVMDRSEPNPPR